MKKINISIVGTGLMGLQHIKAISKSKKANLHSIVDISDNAKKLSNKYKIPLYSDVSSLLKSNQLDAVIVATPNQLHEKHTISFLKKKIPVLLEKPISDNIKSAKKINSKIRILLVTVLTSITNASIKKIGHTKSIKELVKKQALLAKTCGCHGIVCAGTDLKSVKKIFKGEIVTPGIRLKGDSAGDQKRVIGPKEAFKNGSTALVMGRSIIKGNIKNNISRLLKELK